jgi:competence protein CoiA
MLRLLKNLVLDGMLVAINEFGHRKAAFESEKKNAPFYCPECRGQVILKKGRIKEHHYAHKPPFSCDYGSGETELHRKAKRELYFALSECPECSKCELERRLDGVCPDVSLYVREHRVAIELQRSDVTVDEIARRNLQYMRLGCFVLWIKPEVEFKTFFHLINTETGSYKQRVYRPKQWEIYLHALYFGRIYSYFGGCSVVSYHFDKVRQYVPFRQWYDIDREEMEAGGYFKVLKSMKTLNFGQKSHIVHDFQMRRRPTWKSENWKIPECNLWIDSQRKWW